MYTKATRNVWLTVVRIVIMLYLIHHLCPEIHAGFLNDYFVYDKVVGNFHITSCLTESDVCFGELLYVRTLFDVYYKELASH